MSEPQNTLTEALVTTFWSLMSSIHTCLPGRIEKYTVSEQKADVKPLLKRKYLDDEVITIPVIANVPVIFPRTQKAGITFPLSKGDGVLLVFSERSLDKWYTDAEDNAPEDTRKFDLSDAIAIPGLFNFNQNNIASNNSDLQIQNDGGTIELGKGTTQQLDGILTGKTISPFTGTPYNVLPGANTESKNISTKIRGEF